MQLRKLANSFALLCILCSLGISLMSFTDGRTSGGSKKSDSISLSKNSKSLFSSPILSDFAISIPLNPIVTPFVQSFIKRQSDGYSKMKVWGKSYFDLFDRILTENNLPTQLKYLSVIESDLKPTLTSNVGAVGPWQIMSSVAKDYGLRTGKVDERKDFVKSTKAAAQILSNLYNDLGNWLLVIAAYNAGEGRVRQAIRQANSDNFWKLQKYLPEETRNHVKKFIATHFYFEGTGGVTTMTADEIKSHKGVSASQVVNKNDGLKSVEIQGKYNSTLMAKYLQIDDAYLSSINPGLSEALNKGDAFALHLPADKVELFNQVKTQLLKESIQLLMINSSLPAK